MILGNAVLENILFLFSGTLLFDEKISPRAALIWFRYCGLCTYNPPAKEVGWLEGFLYEAVQSFELLSKFKIKIKKSKTNSG